MSSGISYSIIQSMEKPRPPVQIGRVLEGEHSEEFDYLRQKVADLGIQTIVTSRGGGALLQRTLGFLPQLFEEGALGDAPWGMVGTSTGAISTFMARSIGFANLAAWHESVQSVADFKGLAPWIKLTTKPGIRDMAFLKLNFLEYYDQYMRGAETHDYSDEQAIAEHKKPALNAVVVTRRWGFQPHIYHDEHWQREDGSLDIAKMVSSVEGSCALPVFAATHDEHIGAVIDGALNRYDLQAPISVAERLLEGRKGKIISIEPASHIDRGIHIEARNGLTIIRVAMERQVSLARKAQNIFVFDQEGYDVGRYWGKYAAEVIKQI